jgi:hypothetical protein
LANEIMNVQAASEFETEGYVILRSVVDRATAKFLNDYVVHWAASGKGVSDRQVPAASSAYGAPLMEKLLVKLVPAVEAASGRNVYPTYSYFRVYTKGDALAKHKDRPACEISLSLCLGYRAPAPWPLFVEGSSGVCAAELNVGDAVLYKGMKCLHWREPFEGEVAAQVFLHYVDQNGPHAEWKFDKRTQ